MDVKPLSSPGPAGIGPPPDLPKIAPLRSATDAAKSTPPEIRTADLVSVLKEFDAKDTAALLEVLEPPVDAGATAALVSTLVEHARAGGGGAHIATLVRQIAQQDPTAAEHLSNQPALEQLRTEVESSLRHLTIAAKADAEHAITAAEARVVDPSTPTPPWKTEPTALLNICEKLVLFGGLPNFRKAERLATSINPNILAYSELAQPAPILDSRTLPRRFPKHFDLLPGGPALGGVLLLLLLLLIAASYLFR